MHMQKKPQPIVILHENFDIYCEVYVVTQLWLLEYESLKQHVALKVIKWRLRIFEAGHIFPRLSSKHQNKTMQHLVFLQLIWKNARLMSEPVVSF